MKKKRDNVANGLMQFTVDTGIFIEEVKKRRDIWDTKSKNYHSRPAKKAVWEELCASFDKDFEFKTQTEKDLISNKLINKWRNIRDSFIKYERKKNTIGSSSYIYADQLGFLVEHTSSENGTDDYIESDTSACNNFAEVIKEEEQIDINIPPLKRRRTSDSFTCNNLKNSVGDYLSFNFESSTSDNVQNRVEDYVKNNPAPQDKEPAMHFMLSLLPIIREFNAEEYLEWQSEVLRCTTHIFSQTRHKRNQLS